MKLSSVIGARRVLAGITEKLPFATGYKIAKFLKATDTEDQLFNDKYKEIVEKYRKDDEIPPENQEAANKELAEFGDNEVDGVDIRFTIGDFAGVELTTAQVYALLDVME